MLKLTGLRRIKGVTLVAKIYLRTVGDISLNTLYIYVAGPCKFLCWIGTELSFSNSSLNEEDLLQYVILKVLSYSACVFYLVFWCGTSR